MNYNRITGTFRALRNRNYRLFFTGQGISLIGTWMQQLAQSWLVYRLTGSAFMLGAVGFATQIPSLILFPLAGYAADRLDKQKLIIATQILSLIQATTLTLLYYTGVIHVWHILTLGILLGIINSFDMPVRHSLVVDMVEKREDLGNAIALNSSLFNGARLLGPAIAGLIISIVGEGMCFLFNAVSYIPVIAALAMIRIQKTHRRAQGNPLSEIKAGTKYTFGFPPVRSIILLVALVSFAGMPYTVLLPVFAKTVLGGGAHTLGMLTASSGLGALAGALYLASRKSVIGLSRIITIAAMFFGICLCLFSISDTLPVSLPLLVLTGFSIIIMVASGNTMIQTIIEDDMRGRVMSFYNMAFIGIAPFGSIAAGYIAEKMNAQSVVFAGGLIIIARAVVFAFNLPKIQKLIHPIYVKKGIIQENSVYNTSLVIDKLKK